MGFSLFHLELNDVLLMIVRSYYKSKVINEMLTLDSGFVAVRVTLHEEAHMFISSRLGDVFKGGCSASGGQICSPDAAAVFH